MASGNQVCSGRCADLPTAPPRINRAATVAVVDPPGQVTVAALSRDWMSSVPSSRNSRNRPSAMAVSPTRVTTKALRAA